MSKVAILTQMIFYANAGAFGTNTAAPYNATLSGAGAGGYALRAVALDNRGASATSAVVNVIVNQPGVFDDFEPDIDLSQWSSFGGVLGTDVIATNYGGSVSGTHSLWFGGDAQRFAVTRAVDTTLGGSVSFQLRIANGPSQPWENADLAGEGVVLEYSVNGGGAWTIFGTFDTAGAPYTQGWVPENFSIDTRTVCSQRHSLRKSRCRRRSRIDSSVVRQWSAASARREPARRQSPSGRSTPRCGSTAASGTGCLLTARRREWKNFPAPSPAYRARPPCRMSRRSSTRRRR